MLTIKQKKEFAQEFRVEEGWGIMINVLTPPHYTEGKWIFYAVNLSKGKSIDVYYESADLGYTLYFTTFGRRNGQWDFLDESNSYFDSLTHKEMDVITRKVQKLLNPTEKRLPLLKVSENWLISINNLVDSFDEYNNFDFLFFAIKREHNFFIDINFVKDNNTPYKICLGKNKHKFKSLTYSVYDPIELKSIELSTLSEVIDLIENYMLLTEEYFEKLTQQ